MLHDLTRSTRASVQQVPGQYQWPGYTSVFFSHSSLQNWLCLNWFPGNAPFSLAWCMHAYGHHWESEIEFDIQYRITPSTPRKLSLWILWCSSQLQDCISWNNPMKIVQAIINSYTFATLLLVGYEFMRYTWSPGELPCMGVLLGILLSVDWMRLVVLVYSLWYQSTPPTYCPSDVDR